MSSQERSKERTSEDVKEKELTTSDKVTSSTTEHEGEPSSWNAKAILESKNAPKKFSECVFTSDFKVRLQ